MSRRVGLDIDGVLYEWDRTARYMLRNILPNSPYAKEGTLGKESLNWDYIMEEVAPEHWSWLWTEGVRLGLFRHGHLYPGAIKAVRMLADAGFEIIAITSRPKQAVHDTMDWLSYQRLPISGIHVLSGKGELKSSVTPHCVAYIDDKPENCRDLLENTAAPVVAMPVRAWNRTSLTGFIGSTWQDRFIQVEGIVEFAELVVARLK